MRPATMLDEPAFFGFGAPLDAPPVARSGGVPAASVGAGGVSAPGTRAAAQKAQVRHLQNLQWLAALAVLQKAPHVSKP